MNKRWNKLCVSALACMALVVPLTACEGQLPTPAADTSTKVAPDLTEAQEKKIRLKILKTIDEADQAKNPVWVCDRYGRAPAGHSHQPDHDQSAWRRYVRICDHSQGHRPDGDSYGRRMASLGVHHHDHHRRSAVQAFAGLRSGIRPAELQADGYGSTV